MKRKMLWLFVIMFIAVGGFFQYFIWTDQLQAAAQQTAEVAQTAQLQAGAYTPDFSWQDGTTVTLGRKIQFLMYSAGYVFACGILLVMMKRMPRS
ncbi:hypothetical protein [Paenibacillus agilis]|uniref:Uncharacterized protein n=1 Tax=Paenibacillus agilis TaxID=3020863 RepID=A0A559J2G4_9BACL|nr:hypothetical protein [Paenibacillus agilis]TVX94053.1 hypothetical protein FPZ44_13905 [Paenibacillus agilis]